MSVTSTHFAYDKYAPQWARIRDLNEGRDAVMRQSVASWQIKNITGTIFNTAYIPPLANQSLDEYYAYADRAAFYNATGRTIDALVGLVFAKAPISNLTTAVQRLESDITLAGDNLREFVNQVVYEEITTTRVGILVDYPNAEGLELTRGQAELLNLRPFARMYVAESITNWRTDSVGGAEITTMVTLRESVETSKDEFTSETETRYRVLDLDPDGFYRVRIFDGDTVVSETYPLMAGARMRYIPFVVIGGMKVRKPLLIDLVDTNIAHLRNSADYEHGLRFTGLPTPYATGVSGDNSTLSIGAMTAWLLPDPASKIGYLEFSGQGLTELRTAMNEKEKRMATQGARMLQEERRTAEASSTLEQRTAGEKSILASVAYDVSDAMVKVLDWLSVWNGGQIGNEYELNTDFSAVSMEAPMLAQYLAAVQGGVMPLRDFFEALKRGSVIGQNREFEGYQEELNNTQGGIIETGTEINAGGNSSLLANIRGRLGL